jgi:hypothetical protein
MNLPTQHARSPQPVREKRVTRWHNPTSNTITAMIVEDGEVFSFSVPPGEERELDSKYDRALHQVDCGRDECHRKGWWCVAGHEGTVAGGNAPLLRRVGKNDKLDPMLDPEVQARKALEKSIAAAAAMGAVHQHAMQAAAEKIQGAPAHNPTPPAAQSAAKK